MTFIKVDVREFLIKFAATKKEAVDMNHKCHVEKNLREPSGTDFCTYQCRSRSSSGCVVTRMDGRVIWGRLLAVV
jgi:hypothetical protein